MEFSRRGSGGALAGAGASLTKEWQTALVLALLAALTLVTFWPVLHNDFIELDDPAYVTQNPHVKAGLSWANLVWAFQTGTAGNWHPVTWLSHSLDAQWFHLNPAGHHLTSLLLHTVNTSLVFLVLLRLTGARWRSAFVAALFAVHPLHVESVAWVAERKDVLSTFFFLLTLLAYCRYAQNSGTGTGESAPPESKQPTDSPPTFHVSRFTPHVSRLTLHAPRFYLLSLLFFALGLMSKPMLVTLPFVLLLLDYWPLRRLRLSTLNAQPAILLEKAPFLFLALVSSVVTFLVQDRAHAVWRTLPLLARMDNAVVSYVKYLRKTVWPLDLAVAYPHPGLSGSHPWPAWQIALAALALAAVSFAVVKRRQRQPYLVTGWFWYLGALVPVIGLVQVGAQAMADRYTYIPLIGIFLCVAWGAHALLSGLKGGRDALVGLAALSLVLCAAMTHAQVKYWRNHLTLFERVLQLDPGNAQAHYEVGTVLGGQGNYAGALQHLRAAIQAAPQEPRPHYKLGILIQDLGNPTGALEEYQAAIRLAPAWSEPHNRLGMALWVLNRRAEAVQEYQNALHLEPEFADAHFNLGVALLQMGQAEAAENHFAEAARLNPGDADAVTGIGRALLAQGRSREAVARYQQALKLNPNSAAALNALAWVRATCADSALRDGAEAVRLAVRACQLSGGQQARYWQTLDAAYAEAGRFSDALNTAEKARELAEKAGEKELAAAAAARAELYRKNQPFHQPGMVVSP